MIDIQESKNQEKRNFLQRLYRTTTRIVRFKELWNNPKNVTNWLLPIFIAVDRGKITTRKEYQDILQGFLSLPPRLLQYNSVARLLNEMYGTLEKLLSLETSNEKRGNYFEALCLIYKMRKRRGKFQFFLSNMIVIDPKKPKNEQEEAKYDIIELLLNENDESECWIYACSISDDYLSNNKKSLTAIVDSLNKTFPSLKIRTRFIMPHSLARNDWTPNEIDIGRNVN